MTQRDIIQCVHEPFGDAFYYGPERLSSRFAGDEHAQERVDSGFANSTYSTVMERLEREATQVRPFFLRSSRVLAHSFRNALQVLPVD